MKTNTRRFTQSLHATTTRSALFTSIASLLALHAGLGAEAVFSSSAITNNADSGVGALKSYTALANILGGNVVVNGQTFFGAGGSGTGWTLNAAGNNFTGFTPGGVSGTIAGLFNEFQYGGTPVTNPVTFDVSGLTIGQTYVATFYNAAFGGAGGRVTTVS